MTMVTVSKLTAHEVCGDNHTALPTWYDEYGTKTRVEFVSMVTVDLNEQNRALTNLIMLFEAYRDVVREAAETSQLTEEQLMILRIKLHSVAGYYDDAKKAADYVSPEDFLINMNSSTWWNGKLQLPWKSHYGANFHQETD